ncbi:MAG: dienelactone hydrolase family protein [Acidobacteriota bacterium]|nr:dienelactone hydrolase family protein [Acidobacteriota bacterium]
MSNATNSAVKPSPPGVPGAVLDPERVRGEDLDYRGFGGDLVHAYLARPAAGGSHPGLIAIHEAGGLGEHIRDVANRFANIGHVVLAPDLFTREGGPPPAGDLDALMARLYSMPDVRVLGDLEGAAGTLRARGEVSGKVGCIGFCLGGRYTLLFACSGGRIDAAVDCWGGSSPRPRSMRARRPSGPRRRWSWPGASAARSTRRSAPRITTPRRRSASACAPLWRTARTRPWWTSTTAPATPSSPTTGPCTDPSPPPSCGGGSCPSSHAISARREDPGRRPEAGAAGWSANGGR